jgi:hypothetical protein
VDEDERSESMDVASASYVAVRLVFAAIERGCCCYPVAFLLSRNFHVLRVIAMDSDSVALCCVYSVYFYSGILFHGVLSIIDYSAAEAEVEVGGELGLTQVRDSDCFSEIQFFPAV